MNERTYRSREQHSDRYCAALSLQSSDTQTERSVGAVYSCRTSPLQIEMLEQSKPFCRFPFHRHTHAQTIDHQRRLCTRRTHHPFADHHAPFSHFLPLLFFLLSSHCHCLFACNVVEASHATLIVRNHCERHRHLSVDEQCQPSPLLLHSNCWQNQVVKFFLAYI